MAEAADRAPANAPHPAGVVVTRAAADPPHPAGVVTGSAHHSRRDNPAVRWLTARFLARLDEVIDRVAAQTPSGRVLVIGRGEGGVATGLCRRWSDVTAVDLSDERLRRPWGAAAGPRPTYADARRLPFPDGAFDVAVAGEVLEHLSDPAAGLSELARVARSHLVLSAPRAPWCHLADLVAGRRRRASDDPAGEVNDWTVPDFVRLASRVGAVRDVASSFTRCILWVTSN